MEVEKSKRKTTSITQSSSPQPFWHRRLVSRKTIFPWTRVGKDGLGMIQAYYNCCALYFCYISSTLIHQALDPRGWIWHKVLETQNSRIRGPNPEEQFAKRREGRKTNNPSVKQLKSTIILFGIFSREVSFLCNKKH